MMIPTGLLQPHTEAEYLKLEQMYFELGNFIRSLWVHTEGEDKENYEILKNTASKNSRFLRVVTIACRSISFT